MFITVFTTAEHRPLFQNRWTLSFPCYLKYEVDFTLSYHLLHGTFVQVRNL